MLEQLRTIDPITLNWHAERYDSGRELQALVRQSRCLSLSSQEILTCAQTIAELCIEDGSSFGFVPCLASPALDVWNELLEELNDPKYVSGRGEFFGEDYSIRAW